MKVNYLKNILFGYVDLYTETTCTQQSISHAKFWYGLIYFDHIRKSTAWCQPSVHVLGINNYSESHKNRTGRE